MRNSHSDLLNALPFRPDTAGRYYVSIHAPNGGIAPNRVYYFDTVKVALQANTRYRIVWDVACLSRFEIPARCPHRSSC